MKNILSCVALLLLASCSSTTLITTNDKDAKIYIDGQFVGKGQYTLTDSKMVGSTSSILLKKEGCEDVPYSISKNEEFDAGACAGGVFVLVPFLWIQKYKALHNFDFECTKRK